MKEPAKISEIGISAGRKYCPNQCTICGNSNLSVSFRGLVDGFDENREAYDFLIHSLLKSGVSVCFTGADDPALHLEDITRAVGFEAAHYLLTGKKSNNHFVQELIRVDRELQASLKTGIDEKNLRKADMQRLEILKRNYFENYPKSFVEMTSNPGIYLFFESGELPPKADVNYAKRKIRERGLDFRTLVSLLLSAGFGIRLSLGASQSHDLDTYRKSLELLDFIFDWLGISINPTKLEVVSENTKTDEVTMNLLTGLNRIKPKQVLIKRPMAVGRHLEHVTRKPEPARGVCELDNVPLGIYVGVKDSVPWLMLYCSSIGSNFLVHQGIMPLKKVLDYRKSPHEILEAIQKSYENLLKRPSVRLMRKSMAEFVALVEIVVRRDEVGRQVFGDGKFMCIYSVNSACEGCYQISAKVREYLEKKGMDIDEFINLLDKEALKVL